MSPRQIVELPPEILANILSFLEAHQIISFGGTCRKFHDYVNPGNKPLWRSAFLQSFDDPEVAWDALLPSARVDNAAVEENWDWFSELRRRVIAVRSISRGIRKVDFDNVVTTLLSMVETAKPGPSAREVAQGRQPMVDDRNSKNLSVLAFSSPEADEQMVIVLHQRQLLAFNQIPGRDASGRPVTRSRATVYVEHPESLSRLHTLYGLTALERSDVRLRGIARRLVYDWSMTGEDTDYGPFQRGATGKVHWQLLEAVCSVISRSFERCADGRTTMPQGFHYGIPHRTLADPSVPEDWAGASGSWLGTYAFLDYADLFTFNVGHRPGHRPMLEDEPEACGDLMRLELRLNPKLAHDPKLNTELPLCHDRPMLHFSGDSAGHDGAYRPTIAVRGSVALVPGGREVRWRYLISYGGADQWQLEGVQPGGIRSGGVYGLWSHCDHNENGPVGPFCYFPMELCKPTSVVLRS